LVAACFFVSAHVATQSNQLKRWKLVTQKIYNRERSLRYHVHAHGITGEANQSEVDIANPATVGLQLVSFPEPVAD
jgi:hypothetical protein